MILAPEEAIEFGKELVKLYSEDYVNLVELSDGHGFVAELKDENMRISLSCASNGEASRIFFSFVPDDKKLKTYYELDLLYDDRFNNFYDLIENVSEIFTECDEGLERNINRVYKEQAIK